MATFFGEVVTLPSRAVDDDDEEEEDEALSRFPEPQLTWKSDFQREIDQSARKKISCRTLVIGIGPAATGFLEAYVLWNAADVVATIDFDPNRSDVRPDATTGHRTCSVFRPNGKPDVLICQCLYDVLPEISHVCTEKIFGCLDTSNLEVVVMDTVPTAEYRSHLPPSDITAPFLRSLQSQKHCSKTVCPSLESPNVVKGLSAAVLTHCQVSGLPCAVYVGFLDSLFLDTDDINVFKPLLSHAPIRNVFQENPNAAAVLRKLVERRALQDSLYT